MPLQIEINDKFARVLELVENTSENVFITGYAGSGKSTLLNYLQENTQKNMVVVAPTGVAALNIKGQTIHRFFSFPINITQEKIINREFSPRAKRIYKQLQTLVIDEVSMLRADIFDCIDTFLQIYGPDSNKAFGGVQLVLVGDLYQLPPVVTNQEKIYFQQRYSSPYFFSADAFRKINLEVIELTKIYRQKDTDFIEILGRIRNNQATSDDLCLLNNQLCLSEDTDAEFTMFLTTTNKMAEDINKSKLQLLPNRLYLSNAAFDGQFSAEYFPTNEILEIKEGAQIMFLNNDPKKRWVNGSLGKIEAIKLNENKIRYLAIRLQSNAKLVEVFPYTWEIYKYALVGNEIVSEVAGTFTQFPIRLAWAVTIHKSQGQTFDKICVDIGNGTFANGQLYVALSRCTSLQGISLRKYLRQNHIICDDRITNFMQNYLPITDPEQKINKLLSAAQLRRKVHIVYKKNNEELSRRVIIPIALKGDNLLAFCTHKQEQRSFKVERILEIKNFND
ncbi:MAG: AAA family ATPase [Alphaproteobacteria bacterium]|nr:AAA family ATPase [Alphaproteobacteria bacterium]